MRRLIAPTLAAAVAFATVAAGPSESARADVDHEVELLIDETATVEGGVPQGINPSPFVGGTTGEDLTCSKAPNEYCETILVHLTNPYEEENAKKGRERANAIFELSTPDGLVSDYDLYIYESDADGTKGTEVASAGDFPLLVQSSNEAATVVVTTTEDSTEMWLLVEVYYFGAIAPYQMDIDFS